MIINYIGFILAAWAVIGNDVIQTLGTFLQSNSHFKWQKLFFFIGSVLTFTLLIGWYINDGDVSFGRLSKISHDSVISLWYLLPPIILLIITRFGVPVSTTFLILSIFSSELLIKSMLLKSVYGYFICFIVAYITYSFFFRRYEKSESTDALTSRQIRNWTILQWGSTTFLWSQWLIQDFANIYVFLPAKINVFTLIVSLALMLLMLGTVMRKKGGNIQRVVSSKSNSSNIRSATILDFVYGISLFYFTTINTVPMSTTWAFIGVLAGREIALRQFVYKGAMRKGVRIIVKDFALVLIGIVVSVGCILFLKNVAL